MSWFKILTISLSLLTVSLAEAGPSNPLQDMHTAATESAKEDIQKAKNANEKAWAYRSLASALDSLDRSADALVAIDTGLRAFPDHFHLLNTKAKILVSLGRYQEALDELLPRLEKHKSSEEARGPAGVAYIQVEREGFIAAVYAQTLLGQYDAAVSSLSYFGDLMDPSSYKYRACWYKVLKALGAKPNPDLELSLKQLPRRVSHYDAIISVLDDKIPAAEAIATLNKSALEDEEKQDAMAEMLFFIGVKEKVAQGKTRRLEQLDVLAPYGSAEWKIARVLFK